MFRRLRNGGAYFIFRTLAICREIDDRSYKEKSGLLLFRGKFSDSRMKCS